MIISTSRYLIKVLKELFDSSFILDILNGYTKSIKPLLNNKFVTPVLYVRGLITAYIIDNGNLFLTKDKCA